MTAKPKYTLPYHDHVSYTLSDARHINLFGEIGAHTLAHIANSLDYLILQDKKKPVHIRLNSGGGSVIDGLAVYDLITQFAKKLPIHITVSGACMSMAVVILQAATTRLSLTHSEFLLHEVSYGARGKYSEHKDAEAQAGKLQKKLDAILVERSRITLAELKKLTERRDYTISAQEALKHGLIDEIIQ